jgi:hypothetical protein
MLTECRKLKVKVSKAGNVTNFMNALKKLRDERKKAENLFIDDVEQDVI